MQFSSIADGLDEIVVIQDGATPITNVVAPATHMET